MSTKVGSRGVRCCFVNIRGVYSKDTYVVVAVVGIMRVSSYSLEKVKGIDKVGAKENCRLGMTFEAGGKRSAATELSFDLVWEILRVGLSLYSMQVVVVWSMEYVSSKEPLIRGKGIVAILLEREKAKK